MKQTEQQEERRVFGFKENRVQRAIREWLEPKIEALEQYGKPETVETARGEELAREERQRILAAEIYRFNQQSYEVEHSTGTTAHLVWKRPKGGFAGNLFLTVITLGFWLIIWIPLGVLGDLVTPKHIYLEVLPDGTVEQNTHGWR